MTADTELQDPEVERPSSPSRVPHTAASIRPSVKYVEVEGPNKRFLRQALAPPRPVLPRKQIRLHAPPVGAHGRQLQYDGNWVRGRREGPGLCYYFNGETYQGQWANNQRHGHGRMQYSNADVYEGPWVKDHRTGLAKYFYANGDVFVGRYERNRREGLGTIFMVRKGKKHIAEYKADKPLCGTWAEIDDESLAPMDDFLRSTIPADAIPAVMKHLPELNVTQPDKVLQEVLSPLRSKTSKRTTLIKALGEQLSSFDDFELDRLRHAFVKLSGGDSRVAQLTPERISDVCVAARLDPSHARTLLLCQQLMSATKDGIVMFNDFLRVINNLSDTAMPA
ncbi:hypothetical protein ABBQ32_003952 [Trebouxia sp. C0010 RCD-2024]